jgi:hypothetical protein
MQAYRKDTMQLQSTSCSRLGGTESWSHQKQRHQRRLLMSWLCEGEMSDYVYVIAGGERRRMATPHKANATSASEDGSGTGDGGGGGGASVSELPVNS